MTPHDILKYFSSRRDAIVDQIREIVDIESPSHDIGGNKAVTESIETIFRSTGAEIRAERIAFDEGEHLVIHAFGSGGGRSMLLGHTDTVHPVGAREHNPTRIDGDRFYGCGIFDMKANIILMAECLRFFAENNITPARPISIVLTGDEEIGSFSGRHVAEKNAANAAECLVFEPSANGRVKTGRKGTGLFRLTARGRPAHAGLEPEKGVNAIAELSRQIEKIHAVADNAKGTTVNVTTFHGGTASNVIPADAACDIDVRFSIAAEAERVRSELAALTPTDAGVRLELSGQINRPPLERTDAVIALFERARSLGDSFGYEIGETQVGGASDGNFIAALGVPTLDGLGLAGNGAHTLDEYIHISDIAPRAALLTLLLS